jgi:hypothetical protein
LLEWITIVHGLEIASENIIINSLFNFSFMQLYIFIYKVFIINSLPYYCNWFFCRTTISKTNIKLIYKIRALCLLCEFWVISFINRIFVGDSIINNIEEFNNFIKLYIGYCIEGMYGYKLIRIHGRRRVLVRIWERYLVNLVGYCRQDHLM